MYKVVTTDMGWAYYVCTSDKYGVCSCVTVFVCYYYTVILPRPTFNPIGIGITELVRYPLVKAYS